jgi:hypothetical protein
MATNIQEYSDVEINYFSTSGDKISNVSANGLSLITDALTTPIQTIISGGGFDTGGQQVSFSNLYNLKQATPALRIPATTNVFLLENSVQVEDETTLPTRMANISAIATLNPQLTLKANTGGAVWEEADLTQNGVSYIAPAGTTTTRTWTEILNSSGTSNTLDQVLSNGNTATGTYANINLVDTDPGGQLNPILNLQNTNATGSVALEVYKNKPTAGVAGDVLFNQSVYGKDNALNKQEYTRITHSLRDASSTGEDGSIEFGCFVNGAFANFLQINGNENEVNILRTLDMTGNNIRTSTGDLSILTTTSSGNGNMTISTNGSNAVGDITISAKNNMVLSCGTAPDTIDLQGEVKMTNGRLITFTNASNSDTGIAQSQAFTITDGTETGTLQKGTIQTSTSATNNTMTPTKLFLNDTTNNKSITLDNDTSTTENRIDLFKNAGGGVVAQSGITNQTNNQMLFLTQSLSSGSTNKTIQLSNTASGALIYDNTEDNNGFTIQSNKSLDLVGSKLTFNTINIIPRHLYSTVAFSVIGSPTNTILNFGVLADMVAGTTWKVDVGFYTGDGMNNRSVLTYIVADTTNAYVEENSAFGYTQGGLQTPITYDPAGTPMGKYCSFTDTFLVDNTAVGACSFILTGGTSDSSTWSGTCRVSIVLTRLV